jgi:hypothetical protein
MSTQPLHRAPRYTSAVAITAIACFTYSVLALLLLHVLRPDYAPVNHMISDYAVGRYGWVMATWFLAMSCGCLMREGKYNCTAQVILVMFVGAVSSSFTICAVPTQFSGGGISSRG